MALIKTIQEVRALIPHLSKLSNTANLPNIDKSNRKHIIPIIGDELYDDLNTKYNAAPTTLSNPEKELVKQIQLPLISFSYLDDLGLIHATITDSGIRRASTNEMPAAFRWEVEQLKNTLADYAADGIEILLGYLYSKKADYPLWTASDAFTELESFLIKTGTDFDKQYKLYQPLRTFWTLKPIMADVEENYLASILGRNLLNWVKAQDSLVISVTGGEVDIKKLLKKATAFLTIKHACEQLPVRIDEYGFTVSFRTGDLENPSIAGRGAATQPEIEMKKLSADREGQNYLHKAADYLTGVKDGQFDGSAFDDGFSIAFENSPLNITDDIDIITNGNERRKIFRF